MTASTHRGRPIDRGKDQAILRAARRLLKHEGPQALTMERVAQAAGVSKVTLYRRYPNRQALLEAVVALDASRVFRALLRPAATSADVRAQLEAFVVDLAGLLCGPDHRRYIQALGELPRAGLDVARIWRQGPARAHSMLVQFLQGAQVAGHLRCEDVEQAAELLLGMAVGLDLVRSLYRVPLARQRLAVRRAHATRVVEVFWHRYALGSEASGAAGAPSNAARAV
ncbi:Nucleoid occlusion factor SlmA [Tepidimonas thermarum]|uniref:Nucleoid occlusion factor SlmA n=1 Tax=Tepidimonas thermarum TaxID=335431 RepID=A0A554X689_9BURK|nr:TetR/AcrR family transcriptional regulator [Tepidimonas thermarum]TSE31276.1 Nucleoid occlusion factor SlmA [Tepidimonas thermarum]